MGRPVIAVTTYEEPARWGAWDQRAVLVPTSYVGKVQEAGARVVLLPPDSGDTDVLEWVDGLLLTGGPDIDARLYSQVPHESADEPRMLRDAAELNLYRRARDLGLPVLGICRGLQLMAVAHGGSLVQNLPDLALDTVHRRAPGTYARHEARLAEGSLIARLLGAGSIEVNSSHHQSVAHPGDLTPTGWAADDTIEVCEDASAKFAVGVQWHPEVDEDPRLFQALVAAASR